MNNCISPKSTARRFSLSALASNYTTDAQKFQPRRILILTKLSRYEFEKRRHPELTERQLEESLRSRGSDYNLLLYHHYIHKVIRFYFCIYLLYRY